MTDVMTRETALEEAERWHGVEEQARQAKEAAVMRARYEEGLSISKIARALEMSESGVFKMIERLET